MITENEVIELLKRGWTIDYAPITGGILLIGSQRLEESQSMDVSIFLNMRSSGTIKRLRQMKGTHPLFRGLVDVYGLDTGDE